MVSRSITLPAIALVAALVACATPQTLVKTAPGAPTQVIVPRNNYTPAQDVQLGQQAAEQVRKQLPILRDELLTSYVTSIGQRLVAVIPPDLQHPEFRYSFEVVNVKEINAFALPGGPMFVNRGMLAAAANEGEIAGVMAHELSHVILRHGTAQASKATPYQVGAIAGQVVGAIVGGQLGGLIAQGTQFGISTAFMRFSREFEKQADIEGAHLMARAGYDAQDMAMMFKTLEAQGGASAPDWLSDHPNPGDRFTYITQEAQALHVANPVRDTREFQAAQAHLKELPPAPAAPRSSE
ncbi:MAG TPA: M48 family metallopeptidase [Vicinamibacterales bacterium]|nr:M48 family metallopeptidase [Vicinamibacterales bacterium]